MKKLYNSETQGLIKPICKGIIVGIIVNFIFLLLFAMLLTKKQLPQSAPTILALSAVSIGALTSGFFAAKINKSNGLIIGLLTGLLLFSLYFLLSLFISQNSLSMNTVIKLILILVSSSFGGIFGINIKKKKKYI